MTVKIAILFGYAIIVFVGLVALGIPLWGLFTDWLAERDLRIRQATRQATRQQVLDAQLAFRTQQRRQQRARKKAREKQS